MTKKIVAIVSAVLLLVCAFAGCAGTTVDLTTAILGTWTGEAEGVEITYSFNEDGTGYTEGMGVTVPITYTLDGNTITVVSDGAAAIEDMFGMTIDELLAAELLTQADVDELNTTETMAIDMDGENLVLDGVVMTKAAE